SPAVHGIRWKILMLMAFTGVNEPLGNAILKDKPQERMLGWHKNQGHLGELGPPSYGNEVPVSHIPRLASGRPISRDLLAASRHPLSATQCHHQGPPLENYSDPRDAGDARYSLNGRDVDGTRIIVEFAKGGPRGPGYSRDWWQRTTTRIKEMLQLWN
ncbi:hypothetical protein BVRB_014850, partial [Beta vulgaris subsp. vulgaris]